MNIVKIVSVSAFISIVCLSSVSNAAENEGFMQRLMGKIRPKAKTSETTAKKETPAQVGAKAVVPATGQMAPEAAAPATSTATATATTGVTVKNATAGKPTITKQDLADSIEDMLDSDEEIIGSIPEIKQTKDAKNNTHYLYKGTMIADLDSGTMDKVYFRVLNEQVRLRTERLNMQMDSLRQSQQVNQMSQEAARTTSGPQNVNKQPSSAPAQPPQVTTPSTPNVPASTTTPVQPQTPTQAPSEPPSPPKR
jgi:hypothetical protein